MLFAAEVAETAKVEGENGLSKLLAYIGVALAVGIPGLGTGWAQSRIGAAGAGTIAERPETAIWVIVMLAIPETTVILGFVIAFMLMGKI
ncbi:MAG: ATPase [Candidatus Hydrothermales bacterium]